MNFQVRDTEALHARKQLKVRAEQFDQLKLVTFGFSFFYIKQQQQQSSTKKLKAKCYRLGF